MPSNWCNNWFKEVNRKKQIALPVIHNVRKKAKKVAKRKKSSD